MARRESGGTSTHQWRHIHTAVQTPVDTMTARATTKATGLNDYKPANTAYARGRTIATAKSITSDAPTLRNQ